MLRRDQFLDLLFDINSPNAISRQIYELEIWLDNQLRSVDNAITFINSDIVGSFDSTSGIETLSYDDVKPTLLVHRSFGNDQSGTFGVVLSKINGATDYYGDFPLWSTSLKNVTGESAVETPWIDKVLAEVINGELRLEIPSGYTKFAVQAMVNKYMNIGDPVNGNTKDGNAAGNWSRDTEITNNEPSVTGATINSGINVNPDGSPISTTDFVDNWTNNRIKEYVFSNPEVMKVEYDTGENIVYLVIKLFT